MCALRCNAKSRQDLWMRAISYCLVSLFQTSQNMGCRCGWTDPSSTPAATSTHMAAYSDGAAIGILLSPGKVTYSMAHSRASSCPYGSHTLSAGTATSSKKKDNTLVPRLATYSFVRLHHLRCSTHSSERDTIYRASSSTSAMGKAECNTDTAMSWRRLGKCGRAPQ